MDDKKDKIKLKGSLKYYLRWPLLLTLLLVIVDVIIFTIDARCGMILALFVLLYLVIALVLYYRKGSGIYKELVNFATGYGMLQKTILRRMDVAYAILDKSGRILWVNDCFNEIFKDSVRLKLTQHNIQAILPTVTEEDFGEEFKDFERRLSYEGRDFRACIKKLEVSDAFAGSDMLEVGSNEYLVAVTLFDETEINRLLKANADEKLVAGLIYIDNYDEALESVEEVRRSLLVALVDRKINKYIGNVNGVVKKVEKDKYFIIFKQKFLNTLQSSKFSLLDEVKTVNIGNDMAVTISIGLGVGGNTYIQNCDLSRIAIDLALGRGGDQAIVKEPEKVYYYGGKSKSVEKNTRVKARIKAHALREILDTKDKVLIMGHSIADIDSLGAGIGLYRAIKTLGKKSSIVLNTVNSSLKPLHERFIHDSEYEPDLFINNEQALSFADENTLIIMVDVNRPSYTECPELLTKSKAVVLLDHHRQCAETIQNALLSYIEPYASSTCEMVSEILQYIGDNIRLRPQEADALYAGIVIDTNNFANKTGVRTFEAAAFLRKAGADVIRVKKMFRDTEVEYKAKAEAIQNAEVFEKYFAITECTSVGIESPTVIGAQAANELLNIRGIKASFVITDYNHKKYISARSIDEINVQLIMERLGGGGHLNVAGAQLEGCSMEEAMSIVKETVKGMLEDGDI